VRNCKQIQEAFPEAAKSQLSGEAKDKLEEHLEACPHCRDAFEEYQEVVRMMDSYQRPEHPKEQFSRLWNGIEENIKQKPGWKPVWLTSMLQTFTENPYPRSLRYAIAALILIAGIMIGRMTITPETSNISQHKPAGIQAAALRAKTGHYLDRSKMLLLGMVNHDPAERINFSKQQTLSRKLIREAVALKDELADNKEFLLRGLIEDLEIILLQIAYLEQEYDLDTVEMIRTGIERNSLLFKINLEEIESAAYDKYPESDQKPKI